MTQPGVFSAAASSKREGPSPPFFIFRGRFHARLRSFLPLIPCAAQLCSPMSSVPMTLEKQPREPAFNVPMPVLVVMALLLAIHVVRSLLPGAFDQWVVWAFGFVPARYDDSVFPGPSIPGGWGASIWSFVTYAMLHGDLMHLGFNFLWFLPFGSALARRFGAARFYLFLIVTAIGGALAHLVAHAEEVAPMIGFSGAVSGLMAASTRFAFERGSFLGFRGRDAGEAAAVPALPLLAALRDPRVMTFVALWFGTNILFGLGSLSFTGEGQSVAWEAHIGGFLTGLLLFSVFDPVGDRPTGGFGLRGDIPH